MENCKQSVETDSTPHEIASMDILSHLPYSPDLAPSNYQFSNFEEVGTWLDKWFAGKNKQFFKKTKKTYAYTFYMKTHLTSRQNISNFWTNTSTHRHQSKQVKSSKSQIEP